MKIAQGAERSEVLREALEELQQDRSFDINFPDDTYKRLDELMGPEFDFIIAGHTHLARSLPRKKHNGWYFNSGTWVRLIQLKAEVLKSKELFRQVYNIFKGGSMEALDPYIIKRLTVVVLSSNGSYTSGKLQYVDHHPQGELFSDASEIISR
jgi:hypothetical protein